MRRDLDGKLRTCTNQFERQRVLHQAGTNLLRAASRKSRKPAPTRREEPEPRPGHWAPLSQLRNLMNQRGK